MNVSELLDFIAKTEKAYKSMILYGDLWQLWDFFARRSILAGEICQYQTTIDRLAQKAAKKPRSKGAKKARAKIKLTRKQIKELTKALQQPFTDYNPDRPTYYKSKPGVIRDRTPIRPIKYADFI
jgi:hypothetical protein